MAVDVVTHEAFHLRGIIDEAETECRSLQTMAWTAQQLGATPEQGQAMAKAQFEGGYLDMPGRYRSDACAEGGALDMRPDDPRFPYAAKPRAYSCTRAPARPGADLLPPPRDGVGERRLERDLRLPARGRAQPRRRSRAPP